MREEGEEDMKKRHREKEDEEARAEGERRKVKKNHLLSF